MHANLVISPIQKKSVAFNGLHMFSLTAQTHREDGAISLFVITVNNKDLIWLSNMIFRLVLLEGLINFRKLTKISHSICKDADYFI